MSTQDAAHVPNNPLECEISAAPTSKPVGHNMHLGPRMTYRSLFFGCIDQSDTPDQGIIINHELFAQ